MQQILITGANRGIGLALVRQYAERGESVHIFAACRTPDKAVALHELARGVFGRHVTVIGLDVGDASSIDAAFDVVSAQTSHLDLLIHNAGVANSGRENVSSRYGRFEFEEILAVLRINVIGAMVMTQRFYPLLQAVPSNKSIVAGISSGMGSIAGVNATETLNFAYSGSKTLMNHFLHHLAAIGANDGLLTVALSPGWVRTDMGGSDADLAPEDSARGMIGVLDNLTPADSGKFLNHDGGEIAW